MTEIELDDLGPVREHYASEGVVARVLTALRNVNGPQVPITPDTLAPIDHFHGKGAIATEELATILQPKASDHVLDIGRGIGGPARWIAAKYGCRITGVDLTPGFCEAARELNSLTGLAARINILHCSALAIPVSGASFDGAYSQAVLMNISDKPSFLREAFRVLRPGGLLALSFVGSGPAGEPYYPLPWAATAATSFLATLNEVRSDLLGAGFEIVTLCDTSTEVAAALAPMLSKLETEGLPPLGEHVVTGGGAKTWRINAMRSLRDRRTSMIEALARKPAWI
jgi:ubiquinone/menaquinone biosynthesis C-methylase UbiE